MIRTDDMLYIISQMNSPLLAVEGNRCVLVRHRKAECLRCAAVCTTGAISRAPEGGIAVNPQLCIGCGTCATVCPSGCLEPQNPPDEALFGTMAEELTEGGAPVVLTCATAAAAAGTRPTVECLGRIDETFLVEAVVRGAVSITLISGNCSDCPHQRGGQECDAALASAARLLACFGRNVPLQKLTLAQVEPQQAASALSRSDNPSESPVPLPKPAAEELSFQHVQSDGTLPHFVPQRRLRLFNSLKALGEPCQQTLNTKLWGQVSVDTDICRSCRMCAVFCPTAAISPYDKSDGSFGISHRSALCMQCRLCETICPERAISVSDEVSLEEFLTGKQFRFKMDPIGWNPSAPDSISTRMARYFATDAVQDPQATNKPGEMAERRAYAQKKEAARRAARQERKQ
ncbi:4Fe-4S dicluster domain-containing protein [Parvibacter caecicola]|uniref:4Fe-4S dicluster domain-containing protein n=1 Tax=Parvibacter caecicola TaxID=747645 RepID=A0A3N0ABB2_9ACTN|nr:4Fe-4S binding protein [Parvibacter caecicola]MBB3171449.1 ferredoxin [Parvibacter caecicola]MCR2042269.1 4Fe-4S binding protein [Parvibacter caecicola]RNL11179.1 hypothetical protein DMP11_04745 [Parvibacter caecicola]TJW09860.1 4Fe-4S dicluster domain-containing protein [Parvibacter caecicola]